MQSLTVTITVFKFRGSLPISYPASELRFHFKRERVREYFEEIEECQALIFKGRYHCSLELCFQAGSCTVARSDATDTNA
jgi:hypothetical protein